MNATRNETPLPANETDAIGAIRDADRRVTYQGAWEAVRAARTWAAMAPDPTNPREVLRGHYRATVEACVLVALETQAANG